MYFLGPSAVGILRKGLDDLQSIWETMLDKFDAAVQTGDYENDPEMEV